MGSLAGRRHTRVASVGVVALAVVACDLGSGNAVDPAACKTCTVLGSGLCDPSGIALHGSNVYWTESLCGTVMTVPASGGAATTLVGGSIFGANDKATAMAVDDANVYWIDQGDGLVLQAPIGGGAPTTLARSPDPAGIAVDATNVYWTDQGDPFADDGGAVAKGTIVTIPIGGGVPTTLVTGLIQPSAIVVHAGTLYWVNSASAHETPLDAGLRYFVSNQDGSVMSAPISGGIPTTLASGQDPYGLAVDAASVYWTNTSEGTVMMEPFVGGPPVILASGQPGPLGIAVDATRAYWAAGIDSTGDGNVMTMPLVGGMVTKLASGQNAPLSIAVDDTSVYWTDPGGDPIIGGKLVKIAKP